MHFDSAFRDIELATNLFIGQTLSNLQHDFYFSATENIRDFGDLRMMLP